MERDIRMTIPETAAEKIEDMKNTNKDYTALKMDSITIDTSKWDLGYSVYEEAVRQLRVLALLYIKPEYVSLNTEAYKSYCVWKMKADENSFSMVSDMFGYPIIVNPYQIQYAIVLSDHKTEFLYAEKLKEVRGIK